MNTRNIKELLQAGVANHKSGHLDIAKKIYLQILKLQPENPDANHLLGLIEHSAGRNTNAEKLLRTALSKSPNNSFYLGNLGQVLLAQRKFKDSIQLFHKSLKHNRKNIDSYNGMGVALLNTGDTRQAIKYFREALKQNPDFHNAQFNLGNAYKAAGLYKDAAKAYSKYTHSHPNDIDAGILLARTQRLNNDPDAALATLKRLIKLKPESLEVINLIAELHEHKSELATAKKYVEKSLSIKPDQPAANRLLAIILRRQGATDKAISILSGTEIPTSDHEEGQKIHFELGKLYDRAGNYKKAIEHFTKGNELQKIAPESHSVDKNRYLEHVRNTRKMTSLDWFRTWTLQNPTPGRDTPIFQVSFPRSGTTLLDQILDSHPDIQVMEEVPVISEVINEISRLPEGYPGSMAKFKQHDINIYRKAYLSKVRERIALEKGKTLVDKLPLNIAEIRIIYRLFPDAKIIFSMRHPYDVCLSNFMQHFSLNDAMANFLTLKDSAILYDAVMSLWRHYSEILPLDLHTVKYEDLVEDVECEVRKLLGFLGLDWDDAVLNFSAHAKTRKSINTPSYQAVTEPIYKRAKYRWKNYEAFIDPVKSILDPHATHFGY